MFRAASTAAARQRVGTARYSGLSRSMRSSSLLVSSKQQGLLRNKRVLHSSKRTLEQHRIRYFFAEPDSRDMFAFHAIIGLNVTVFLGWRYAYGNHDRTMTRILNDYFTASTYGVMIKKNILSLVGSSFSHMDTGHILANMITFYFFGKDVFAFAGRRFAIGLYLIGGAVSAYVQVAQAQRNRINMSVLGASGAVSSFVAYSILMNPRATVILLFVPMPAALYGLLYVFQDVYGMYHRQSYGSYQIGHEAHLAGAAVGLLAFFSRRGRIF